ERRLLGNLEVSPRGEDRVIQPTEDVFASEGDTVTLDCTFETTRPNEFYWYQQYPGKQPQFIISHSGTGRLISDPVSGLSVTVREDEIHLDLQISSAALTDSAVYYCAVKPTVTGNTTTLYKNLWRGYSTTSTRGSHTLINFNRSMEIHSLALFQTGHYTLPLRTTPPFARPCGGSAILSPSQTN
uniref:Ig-like domain-containing protein n=1 Tax=Labrus bergylta TaxID=56723 RepID=A0A3Q3EJV3_9LABR